MVKRIVRIIVPLITCAVLFAQEKGNVWRTWYLKPAAGKIIQLEKGLKDHVEKFHGKGQWPEYYHDILTGPNAGSLMGWSGPHTFKAFDDRVRSDADFKHWGKYVAPYVDNTDANISLIVTEKDLSYKPKSKGPYWHLSYNVIRPGAHGEYVEFLEAIKQTKMANKNPLSHNIYRVASGKYPDTWIWEYPGKSIMEISGSMQSPAGQLGMADVIGEKEAKRMNAIYQKVVKYRVREILKDRPDLSSPEDNNE